MTLSASVSSAGESPSVGAAHHMLWAGVLIHEDRLDILSNITLEETPKSEVRLTDLGVDVSDFRSSVSSTFETPMAVDRALQLYLEQRLTRHSFLTA